MKDYDENCVKDFIHGYIREMRKQEALGGETTLNGECWCSQIEHFTCSQMCKKFHCEKFYPLIFGYLSLAMPHDFLKYTPQPNSIFSDSTF